MKLEKQFNEKISFINFFMTNDRDIRRPGGNELSTSVVTRSPCQTIVCVTKMIIGATKYNLVNSTLTKNQAIFIAHSNIS
jgi:hypothetical protein